MEQTRKFSVHPHMIYSLISGQAGTLGKAVLENLMNGIDALASRITVDIDRNKIIITDDGHGFRSMAEIEECFDVFGFPHEEGARKFGQFGIGRAQLWCFASAIWHTNTFVMDVDIKRRGLDYTLLDNQEPVKGLRIESTFYTPMSTQDIFAFKQELKELALFAEIPIILNGEQINSSPSEMKWDFETDDAFIKLSDKSQLAVYNLGVLVRHYSTHQVGSGGTVVTKPGVRFALNIARNDILVAECKVWARIKPYIQTKSDEKVKRKNTKLNSEELENRSKRFIGGEVPFLDIAEIKLITDITNRGHTVESFMCNDRGDGRRNIITTSAEGSNMGDRAHTSKLAFVVHPATFARFGVETLDDFKNTLFASMDNLGPATPRWYQPFKESALFEADITKAVPTLSDGHLIIRQKEWTKKERGVISALRKVEHQVLAQLKQICASSHSLSVRLLTVGVSDTAAAWTDGKTRIAFDRDLLVEADWGIGGFVHIISVMAHEYLHEDISTGTHKHDDEFFQRFHTVHNSATMGNLAFAAYRYYITYLDNVGIKPTKRLLEALTFFEDCDARVEDEPVQGSTLRLAA